MSKQQLIFTAITFILLLSLATLVIKREDSKWGNNKFAEKTPLIEKLDINNVAKFAITTSSEQLKISLKNDEWIVLNRAGYPANFAKIRNLMLTLSDLKIAQKLRMNKNMYDTVKLLPPENNPKSTKNNNTGTLIVLYDYEGNTILSLILGELHYAPEEDKNPTPYSRPMPNGRYIMISNSNNPVLSSNPLTEISSNPSAWLSKDFINITNLKSLTKFTHDNKKIWKISRKTASSPFNLEDLKPPQQPNPRKMYEATSVFANMKFSDVISAKTSDKITHLKDADYFQIHTFDNIVYKIKLSINKNKAFAKASCSLNLSGNKESKEKDKKKLNIEKIKTAKKIETKQQIFSQWIYEIPLQEAKQLLIDKKDFIRKNNTTPTIMGQ